jgi:hypothetical protein
MKTNLFVASMLLVFATLNPQLSTALAQGTAFTYQGRLTDGASPANGSYDLKVLAKVASLPITTWNFKTMNDGRHMGPMAQDFYAAFGLGGGDTTITTVDPDGVAPAAIQGLNEKVDRRSERAEVRIQKLETENTELKKRLDALEMLIHQQESN